MKWLVVSSLFPPHSRGGSEIVAHRQAQLLREAGEEVAVVASALPGASRYAETTQGWLRVIRYRPWNAGTVFDLPNFYLPHRLLWHALDAANLHSARVFRRILERERPDAVLSHGLKDLGYLLPRTAKRFGAKTIHTLHDVQLIEPSGVADPAVTPTLARRAWASYARACIGSPDAMLFPSAWLKEVSERWGFFPRSRRCVVRNPLSSPLAPRPSRPIRTVLFLGQLERHKGIIPLLEAFRGVGDGRLLVVGDGRLADMVRAETERNPAVRRLGKREGTALSEAWSEADLVVVPSTCAENAPLVIQEAAAHGVPVIASAVGGIPELVDDGVTGSLVPPGDAVALRAAIEARIGTTTTEAQRAAMAARVALWGCERYLRELREIVNAL